MTRELNVVHQDENWRQRLQAEQTAARQWREEWGFLEHAKPAGSVHFDRSMPSRYFTRTIAEQGAMYPFLERTFRQNRDGSVSSGFTVGGTARNLNGTASSPSRSSQAKAWQGDPSAPVFDPYADLKAKRAEEAAKLSVTRQIAAEILATESSTADVPRHLQTSLSSLAPRPASSSTKLPPLRSASSSPSASHSSSAPLSSSQRPSTPLLHLDRSLAQTLRPAYHQSVGSCVWTSGVDPAEKYRSPVTTSHEVGWDVANRSLEFFGVGQHSIREFRI